MRGRASLSGRRLPPQRPVSQVTFNNPGINVMLLARIPREQYVWQDVAEARETEEYKASVYPGQ
jgi:hypothetical protein